jgi:predicted O-linked N-acetylglucosamine transferase (SPINDLY family)
MSTFYSIDVCLDTVPYNGVTTSLDGIWMGTPTLTLVGNTPVGRSGLHICKNLGLPLLIAPTPVEFVAKAVELTSDLGRLAQLRASLRSRLKASPLMDALGFTRDLENAYRTAWHTWCASASM